MLDFIHSWLPPLDRRVDDWPLMSGWGPTFAFTAAYLLFVAASRRISEAVAPLSLRPLLIVYNAAVALLNAYIFAELWVNTQRAGYSYTCQNLNVSGYVVEEMRIAGAIWWFYASKLIEYLDTVFFVVRGNLRQLSFLHVYHHTSMPLLWYIGARYLPGGMSVVGPMFNSAVHVVMYGYYGLAAAFPAANFWWKRYITLLQLVQFCCVLVLTSAGAMEKGCTYPKIISYSQVAYMISFLYLFSRFYLSTYTQKVHNPLMGVGVGGY